MKINEDCIKDVLEYFVENLSIKITGYKGGFNKISMQSVMEYFLEKYSKEDVWYSIYNLSQERYIETNNIIEQSHSGFGFVFIFNVTHKGHQLYESIQPKPVWDKTKSVISKVGVHTLNFIESVAHDVAVESAKQIIDNVSNI